MAATCWMDPPKLFLLVSEQLLDQIDDASSSPGELTIGTSDGRAPEEAVRGGIGGTFEGAEEGTLAVLSVELLELVAVLIALEATIVTTVEGIWREEEEGDGE